jgi:hypothetical protein
MVFFVPSVAACLAMARKTVLVMTGYVKSRDRLSLGTLSAGLCGRLFDSHVASSQVAWSGWVGALTPIYPSLYATRRWLGGKHGKSAKGN